MRTDRMGGAWRAAILESGEVSRVVGSQSAAILASLCLHPGSLLPLGSG